MATTPTTPPPVPFPTEDDKNMAMLAYILSIFAAWIGPLIIWVVKKDSKFVAFHALQILFWHLVYLVFIMFAMVFFMVGMMASVAGAAAHQHPGAGPPAGMFIFMPLYFLAIFGGWAVNMVLGIVYAIKAKNGEWTRIIVVGRWARRVAGLSPD
jgi:uncharacterized Tic20 family protein